MGSYPLYKSPAFQSFEELKQKESDYNFNRAKYYLGRYFSVKDEFRAAPAEVSYKRFKEAVNFKNHALKVMNSGDLVEGCLVEYCSMLLKIYDAPANVPYDLFQEAVSSRNCAFNLMTNLSWNEDQIHQAFFGAIAIVN